MSSSTKVLIRNIIGDIFWKLYVFIVVSSSEGHAAVTG
jgi:hypothetical protein